MQHQLVSSAPQSRIYPFLPSLNSLLSTLPFFPLPTLLSQGRFPSHPSPSNSPFPFLPLTLVSHACILLFLSLSPSYQPSHSLPPTLFFPTHVVSLPTLPSLQLFPFSSPSVSPLSEVEGKERRKRKERYKVKKERERKIRIKRTAK